jgi:glycogen(starch) synthase
MRILYWTPLYLPNIGGLETTSVTLLRALRVRGHTACVLTSHDTLDLPDVGEYDGVPIHRFPFRKALATRDPQLMLDAQQRVARLKRAFAPDVVHINLPDPGALVHLRTQGVRPPKVIVTIHAPIPTDAIGPDTIFGALVRAASWVVTPSAKQLELLRRAVPSVVSSSSVVPYGLAAPSALPTPPPAEPRILCPGRLIPSKGFDLAVAAFAMLAARFPQARLAFAGDGPERPRLETQARDLGVADRTDFLGWVAPDQMPAVLGTASVILVPSRWQDPFPMVALEAARMARPVVAARVGGLPESVADGATGLIVDGEDVAGFARALSTLLGDPALAARMGRAAYERACSEYGVERYADDYEQLYGHIVGEAVAVASGYTG